MTVDYPAPSDPIFLAAECGSSLGIHECVLPRGHSGPHACDLECALDHLREDELETPVVRFPAPKAGDQKETLSCRGHVWERWGGSHKEIQFICWLCLATRTKRLGTDVRLLGRTKSDREISS